MGIVRHPIEIPVMPQTKIWRYLDTPKFESLMYERALFFCRCDKFADPFEGSIPKKEFDFMEQYANQYHDDSDEIGNRLKSNRNGLALMRQKFKRQIVVNCWHINNSESDAMWRLYVKDNEGVAISTTVENLTRSLESCQVNVGSSRVRYLDFEVDTWYHSDDYPVNHATLLTPVLHKRKEFAYESEFRIYHHVNEAINNDDFWTSQPNHKGMLIPVDVERLINEVILHPTSGDDVKNQVEKIMVTNGFEFPIRTSAMKNVPLY